MRAGRGHPDKDQHCKIQHFFIGNKEQTDSLAALGCMLWPNIPGQYRITAMCLHEKCEWLSVAGSGLNQSFVLELLQTNNSFLILGYCTRAWVGGCW